MINFSMNRANLKYAAILVVFMLLIIFMFIGTNTDYETNINSAQDNSVWNKFAGIQNGAQSILNNVLPADIVEDDDGCENDYTGENTEQRMDEYLKHRKQCLLKYCGDVCKTRAESGGGKIFNKFIQLTITKFQSILSSI